MRSAVSKRVAFDGGEGLRAGVTLGVALKLRCVRFVAPAPGANGIESQKTKKRCLENLKRSLKPQRTGCGVKAATQAAHKGAQPAQKGS